MTTLRVLLPDAPHPSRADAWMLVDDAGAMQRLGRDVPAAWPAATAHVAVLSAERARLVVLTLPPLPPAKLPAAVDYALEDQLAGGIDPPRLAHAVQRADGRVTIAIAARDLIAAIEADPHGWASIVPECALPLSDDETWTWYAAASGGGFVRTPAGAFAVAMDDDALPAELTAALGHARRNEAAVAPRTVRVAFACAPDRLDRFAAATGIPFVTSAPWRWTDAPSGRYAEAPDWAGSAGSQARMGARAGAAAGAGPLLLVAAALVLHVGATLVQWAALHVEAWRASAAIVALAVQAGVPDAATPEAAVAALVRRRAEARHAAGLAAPGDALPLLAQAAPALGRLPRGTMKSAIYADGAWTLELGKVGADALRVLDRALAERGVAVLQAPIPSGTRVRLSAGL